MCVCVCLCMIEFLLNGQKAAALFLKQDLKKKAMGFNLDLTATGTMSMALGDEVRPRERETEL